MKAGYPCRPCLLPYVHADVLDKYIDAANSSLVAIEIDDILCKAVLINSSDHNVHSRYAIKLPNYEHH